MKSSRSFLTPLVALTLLGGAVLPSVAHAQTLNTTLDGWFNSSGGYNTGNYIAGQLSGHIFHNYFVFDLSGITDTITSATLSLPQPSIPGLGDGYTSPDASEDFQLTSTPLTFADVSSSASGVTKFNSLGVGTVFSSNTITSALNGTNILFNFNAAGLSALNAARGTTFVTGGSVTTVSGGSDQFVFGFTSSAFQPTLTLGTTPSSVTPELPGAMQLLPALLPVALIGVRKRFKKA